MKEQQLQTKIIKYLESIDCYTVKVVSATKRGVPDIIFMHNGRFCAIEIKAPGKLQNVTEIQQWNLDRINFLGGTAIAVDALATVKDVFHYPYPPTAEYIDA